MPYPVQFAIFTLSILASAFLFWRAKPKSQLDWWADAAALSLIFIFLSIFWRWTWPNYYIRYIFIPLWLFVVAITFVTKIKSLPLNRSRNRWDWIQLVASLGVIVAFVSLVLFTLTSYTYSDQPVALEFPLKNGVYYVSNGGSTMLVNGHNPAPAQRYALDIGKLNAQHSTVAGDGSELNQYAIWGDDLYSPCEGQVIEIENGLPDLALPQRDTVNLAGNYVLIHCQAQEVEVLLAHMMKGSIVVAVGELVQENQRLGRVGNSGNTSQPHLHIHATRNGSGGSHLDGEAVPILFDGRFLVRNDVISSLEK